MLITKQFTAATYVFNTKKISDVLIKLKLNSKWTDEDVLPQVLTIEVPDTITIQEAFSLGMVVEAYSK